MIYDEQTSRSLSGTAYEAHLTSLTLEALLAEPNALQTQAHHLTSSLTSLTHTSYPTFLSVHSSTDALSTSLTHFSHSLSSLITTALPGLQDAAAAWNTRTTDVLHERSKARIVLDQHDKLKDLLDVPILIDSCVRNGYFQEALSIANHVAALASRPGAPTILGSIHAEVRIAIAQMLVVLLGTLHEPGRKLPALWKAVNFLRKMDVFRDRENTDVMGDSFTPDKDKIGSSEELLAVAFLSGRLTCLAAALDPISRDIQRLAQVDASSTESMSDHDREDIARSLKKYIDTWREGAYDVITQYSTIFLEQNILPQANSPLPAPHRVVYTDLSAPVPAPSMLPVLCPHLLAQLVPLLQDTLPSLSLSHLPSLLTQLTYCATAFTRAGMDFRSTVEDIISRAVRIIVSREIQGIGSVMRDGKNSATSTTKPSEWLILPSVADSPPSLPPLTVELHSPVHIPPQILTSYPPFARYTNAVLGVLNALRLLAPVAIIHELVDALDDLLGDSGKDLTVYLARFIRERDGVEREARIARAGGDVYFRVLVPFMRRALVEGVYSNDIANFNEKDELRGVVTVWENMDQ